MKTGIELISAERERQITEKGWDAEHDNIANNDGQLADAAICYAMDGDRRDNWTVSNIWPWDWNWWRPTPEDRIRELTKAGALIAAEIDRLNNLQM